MLNLPPLGFAFLAEGQLDGQSGRSLGLKCVPLPLLHFVMARVGKFKPESTDGRREGWANWDEGAYKGESLGSIGTDVTRQRVFSSRTDWTMD